MALPDDLNACFYKGISIKRSFQTPRLHRHRIYEPHCLRKTDMLLKWKERTPQPCTKQKQYTTLPLPHHLTHHTLSHPPHPIPYPHTLPPPLPYPTPTTTPTPIVRAKENVKLNHGGPSQIQIQRQASDTNPTMKVYIQARKSEYDEEIPKSHIADHPMAPRGRDIKRKQWQDSKKTIKVKHSSLSSSARWFQDKKGHYISSA